MNLRTFQIIEPSKLSDWEDSKSEIEHKTYFKEIADRRRFAYSFKDVMWEMFWLHRWKSSAKLFRYMKMRNQIFREGIEIFHTEVDYANIIKSIRELKAAIHILLDQDQQTFLQFQQTRLIDLKNPISHELKLSKTSVPEIPNEKWSKLSLRNFEQWVK